jgi:hypothetical protein
MDTTACTGWEYRWMDRARPKWDHTFNPPQKPAESTHPIRYTGNRDHLQQEDKEHKSHQSGGFLHFCRLADSMTQQAVNQPFG